MEWLCPLIAILVGVMLIGHLMWVIVAAVVRVIFGQSSSTAPTSPAPRPVDDSWQTTLRDLRRLWAAGEIDEVTYGRIVRAIEAHRAKTTATSIAAPAHAAAETPPVEIQPHQLVPEAVAAPAQHTQTPAISAPPAIASAPTPAVPRPAPPRRPVAPSIPPAAPVSEPPARGMADMLASFMEESHIRWGELVGGMLIVLCSIALVISFWSQITNVPILKFFLFTALTAAVFGVGYYTHRRWALPTTSRALLVTASLVVPLNFLAIAAFSEGPTHMTHWVIASEAVATVTFAGLLFMAGRILMPSWPAALVLGVLGGSLCQLLIRRWFITTGGADVATSPIPWALGLAPLACYVGSVAWMLSRVWSWRLLHTVRARRIFTLLGVTSFAALLPLALLAYKSGHPASLLARLSPLAGLYGLPCLAVGLLFWKRLTHTHQNGLRVAGTAIAALGAMVLMAALPLAFPHSGRLLAICAIDLTIFTFIALAMQMPAAHLLAGACLTLGYVIAVHLGQQVANDVDLRFALDANVLLAIRSSLNGIALVVLTLIVAGITALWHRLGRKQDTLYYAIITSGVSALSLLAATAHGLGRHNDHGATWVYLFFAVAAWAAAWLARRSSVTVVACGLLLLTLVQGLVFRFAPELHLTWPWTLTFLSYATLALLGAAVAARISDSVRTSIARPLMISALVASAAALATTTALFIQGVIHIDEPSSHLPVLAGYLVWLTLLLLGLAALTDSAGILSVAQVPMFLAVAAAVLANLSTRAWFTSSHDPLVHPWTIQAVTMAIALVCLAWTIARVSLHRINSSGAYLQGLTHRIQKSLPDRWMTWALIGLLGILALTAAMPAIAMELVTSRAASERLQSENLFLLAGWGSWALLALLSAILVTDLWRGFRKRRIHGLLLIGMAGVLLLTSRWEVVSAGTSALRWWAATYLLLISIALWCRRPLMDYCRKLRWPDLETNSPGLAWQTQLLISVLTGGPILFFSLIPLLITMAGFAILGPAPASFFGQLDPRWSYLPPLVILAGCLVGHAVRDRQPLYALAGGFVLHFAVTLAHLHHIVSDRFFDHVEIVELLLSSAITAGLFAAAWVALRSWLRRRDPQSSASPAWALHGLFAMAAFLLVLLALVVDLSADVSARPLSAHWLWMTPAWLAAAVAMAATWRWTAAPYALPSLYVLGLSLVGLVLDRYDLRPHWMAWSFALALPLYSSLAATLWLTRDQWKPLLQPWGVPASPQSESWRWLVPMTWFLTILGTLLTFWLTFNLTPAAAGVEPSTALLLRLAATTAAFGLAVAVAMFAHGLQHPVLGQLTLMLGSILAVAWAWAWMAPLPPQSSVFVEGQRFLERVVLVLVAMIAAMGVPSLTVGRLDPTSSLWPSALRRALPWLGAVAIGSLLLVLGGEVALYVRFREVPMSLWSVIVVAAALGSVTAGLIAMAVLPGRDPFNLTERGRMTYVYAAEILLAILFMHIRLTMPYLFGGYLRRYWPLIIMALAFTGVGLSEFFRQRRTFVLAQPLERSGAILPLLPVLAFWSLGDVRVHYSLLLLVVGTLYAALAILRRSFGFGLLATLAANGGFWYFLHKTEHWGFWQHPQLWIIPGAICVLLAAYLNRQRLSQQQLSSIRYVCLSVIYISSTAEIFLQGVGQSPWFPLILAAFSVAGVFAGILLRTQSFLFMGATFLLISLATLVWHAFSGLSGLQIASIIGITAGLLIFAVFALFEKKRHAILGVVDHLRQWEK